MLWIREHIDRIAADHPPPLRQRRDDETEPQYSAYVAGLRRIPPYVEHTDKGYHVQWGGLDNFYYQMNSYGSALCGLVSRECMGASLFFETGVTPDGQPWGMQPWFRMRIWLAWNAGRGEAMDEDYDPDRPQAPPQQELNWRPVADDPRNNVATGVDEKVGAMASWLAPPNG